MLAEFSNDDKHRALQLLITGVYALEIDYRCLDCEIQGEFVIPKLAPIIQADAEIGWFPARITGPNPEMQVKLGLQPRITVEDRPRGLFFVLEGIQAEVNGILNAPEIAAGL
jgi:hypothetical protein